MKALTIKKLVIICSLFFMSDVPEDKTALVVRMPAETSEPLELYFLKRSIEDYSTKIETIQTEIELKLFFKKKPYRVLSDNKK